MITTELQKGQGLGNQLWCYATTRVIAADKGRDFGIMSPERFKGADFLDLDFGRPVGGIRHHYAEHAIFHPLNGADIRIHDDKLVDVADDTEIEGYMQDEQYIAHRKDEIGGWLKIKKEYDCMDYASDDICVINFRGGGYVFDGDFFLPRRYWKQAVEHMRRINPAFKFVVVTDDVRTAKRFFPDFDVFHWNIGKDYAVIKNAHYLILSNSSFAWFPAWTSVNLKYCIAPKYWGRHNISDGYWSMGYNITTGWMYQDRKGNLHDYDTCLKELDKYMERHEDMYLHRDGVISGYLQSKRSLAVRIKNNWQIFNTLRNDISTVYALGWIVRARGLRGAIWMKDKMDKFLVYPVKRYSIRMIKNIKRIVKKILRLRTTIPELIGECKAKRSWLSATEIREYRKKIKIYDAFIFFNELDLLEIRLNILDPYVDHFVLLEATETFSGYKKPLYYQENKERFERWQHKIVHYVVDDTPRDEDELRERLAKNTGLDDLGREIINNALTSRTVGKDTSDKRIPAWLREFYQKESLRKALVGLDDEDICYVSDLDEIWNPEILIDYSKDDVFKLKQLPYMYYLNNRSDEDWFGWAGTIATKYKNIRNGCINHLRTDGMTRHVVLRNGGWHWGMQGGHEGAKRKIVEGNHPAWNRPDKTLPTLEESIRNNVDFKGRNLKLWVDESDLPKYLLENKAKYARLFR